MAIGRGLQKMQVPNDSGQLFSDDPEANELCRTNCTAFLVACAVAQSMNAKLIWSFPLKLMRRLELHAFVPELIVSTPEELMRDVIREKPALHRFPPLIAKCVISLCTLLRKRGIKTSFDDLLAIGDAKTIRDFLMKAHGIGIKKSNMTVLLMKSFLKLDVKNIELVSVAPDVHVCRVLERLGIVSTRKPEKVLEQLSVFKVNDPGSLDHSLWRIGKELCSEKEPNCAGCPVNGFCEFSKGMTR